MSLEDYIAAVVTISDSTAAGEREDESGPSAVEILEKAGIQVAFTEVVPDEIGEISAVLKRFSDKDRVDVVVTTGGTGFSPRDVTPEATLDIIERRADGLTDLMRMESLRKTPNAALARGVCGIRGSTLIINLPGSPKAVKENLKALLSVLDHGLVLLRGGKPH
jgi:molybdenum cofactor synthesis domain-containing protein